jgi:hypothetical protein
MGNRRFFFPLIFLSVFAPGAVSLAAQTPLPLILLVEAASSGDLAWRPDWPGDFPPDAFRLGSGTPPEAVSAIEISNGADTFSLKRDSRGLLVEFPFFYQGAVLRARAAYTGSGALESLAIQFPSGGDSAEAEDLNAEFPLDEDQPVLVSRGDAVFFVYIQRRPLFISETWYDEEGNLLAYFKAALLRESPEIIRSLQIMDSSGGGFEYYSFDGEGGITGIRSAWGSSSALYRNRRPQYWETRDASRFALQWDERGFLTGLRGEDPPLEYRYEYEVDKAGNWIKRQDIALVNRFDVYAPRPGTAWTRGISYRD